MQNTRLLNMRPRCQARKACAKHFEFKETYRKRWMTFWIRTDWERVSLLRRLRNVKNAKKDVLRKDSPSGFSDHFITVPKEMWGTVCTASKDVATEATTTQCLVSDVG